jgi:hypothetical protein
MGGRRVPLPPLTAACAGHGAAPVRRWRRPRRQPSAARRSPSAAAPAATWWAWDDRDGAAGPRFRDLSLRFNAISLQRRFGEISAHGSGQMPPIQITAAEAEDLVACFESLGGR